MFFPIMSSGRGKTLDLLRSDFLCGLQLLNIDSHIRNSRNKLPCSLCYLVCSENLTFGFYDLRKKNCFFLSHFVCNDPNPGLRGENDVKRFKLVSIEII